MVLGANEGVLAGPADRLERLLHDERAGPAGEGCCTGTFGVVTGSMTTIHCYTGSQPTVDAPAADFARSRAAALSMVPTTTSAQRLLDVVLPEVAGRIEGVGGAGADGERLGGRSGGDDRAAAARWRR